MSAAPSVETIEEAQYALNELYARMEELALAAETAATAVAVVNAPGDYKLSGRATPDAGWLLCDFALVAKATYPALYAAIGDTHGVGNATQFRLPSATGRVPAGAGTALYAAGATAHPLASYVGEETHTLLTSELPTNTYTSDAPSFQAAGGTVFNFTPGGNQPHNTMQPTWFVNVFIKT